MLPLPADVRPLCEAQACAIARHLLTLGADDRYARFGHSIGDEALFQWVHRMDWSKLQWWGIWSPIGESLTGALQLSRTRTEGIRELALSVHPSCRRRGFGTRLLSAAIERSPEVRRLVCHHGHPAVHNMTRRLGWTWVAGEAAHQIAVVRRTDCVVE
jgi:GNAT superfamily N-acetyltransferase